ncbi:MAG: succinylglutamate desuccinylase/aspartoacylase family protein [Bdellovibrionales bacterium]
MPDTLLVLKYDAPKPGPKLLVFGAVHGHELCGMHAISRLRTELESGALKLQAGSLTLMPLCNPVAYRAGVRYVVEDVNRIIRHHPNPQHDEQRFADTIARQIDACDVILDLHSTTTGAGPSLFLDYPTPKNFAMAQALGIPRWVAGWTALYDAMPGLSEGDTASYANTTGKYGLFIEAGQHDELAAPKLAYEYIRRTLAHLNMMSYDAPPVENIIPAVALMKKIVVRDKPGTFAGDWQHLQTVKAGTVIINYDDGTTWAVEKDSVLVLPKPYAKIGQEWIYIADLVDVSAVPLAA